MNPLGSNKADHFGSIWDVNVKKKVVIVSGDQILTYKEMSTVLTQIKAVLNSCRLYTSRSEMSERLPHTPSHFSTDNKNGRGSCLRITFYRVLLLVSYLFNFHEGIT